MRTLAPIPLDRLPPGRGRVSPHESLFQSVLQLVGLALPVECESYDAARQIAHACQAKNGRGRVLGIQAIQRGKTIFLYRRNHD